MKIFMHYCLWRLGFDEPKTFYSQEACELLSKYAKGQKSLVELGCWEGVNTSRIRAAMAPEGTLYAVDPYLPGRLGISWVQKVAHRQVERIKNGNVIWMRMSALEGAAVFMREGKKADFIFSDCLNTYEGMSETWQAWRPLLNYGGIYIIANSQTCVERNIVGAGSIRFTANVVMNDSSFQCLEIKETFTVLKKIRHDA